jgi:lipopolysaccharide/colanic/teichoic acid biosynthesis glycosyltransferase
MAEVPSPSVERAPSTSPAYGPGGRDRPPARRRAALRVKHAIDRVVAACGLILTAPLLAAVALALRRATGQPLRREERIGERGRTIALRSLAITDDLRRGSRAWSLVAATGIAALPQLWSVLRGELSVVGPRPRGAGHAPPPVRPGLTGLAQLEQMRRCLPVTEQLELDDDYARTWSLRLDAAIVWRTLWTVLR